MRWRCGDVGAGGVRGGGAGGRGTGIGVDRGGTAGAELLNMLDVEALEVTVQGVEASWMLRCWIY